MCVCVCVYAVFKNMTASISCSLRCLLFELKHYTMRKCGDLGRGPAWGVQLKRNRVLRTTAWAEFPVTSQHQLARHVSESLKVALLVSCWAAPSDTVWTVLLKPHCSGRFVKFMNKPSDYFYFKPLWFRLVCYIATGTANSMILLFKSKLKRNYLYLYIHVRRWGLIWGEIDYQFYFRLLQINDRTHMSNKKLENVRQKLDKVWKRNLKWFCQRVTFLIVPWSHIKLNRINDLSL